MLAGIDATTVVGLRDRAVIALMTYTFARVGALVLMNAEDYFPQGKRWWVRLHEKGGKLHDVPTHHKLEEFLDAYCDAAGLWDQKKAPLFRTTRGEFQATDRQAQRTAADRRHVEHQPEASDLFFQTRYIRQP